MPRVILFTTSPYLQHSSRALPSDTSTFQLSPAIAAIVADLMVIERTEPERLVPIRRIASQLAQCLRETPD
jgi:hypothetical protein